MVLLVTTRTGSLGYAGLAAGVLSLGAAVGGPFVGRLADRHGQRPVIVAASLLNAAFAVVFVAEIALDVPRWLALATAALTGAATPQIGPLMRSRWVRLLRDRGQLSTAMSWEGAADEIVYILGPVVVSLFTLISPSLAMVAGAAMVAVFGVWAGAAPECRGRRPRGVAHRPRAGLARPGHRLAAPGVAGHRGLLRRLADRGDRGGHPVRGGCVGRLAVRLDGRRVGAHRTGHVRAAGVVPARRPAGGVQRLAGPGGDPAAVRHLGAGRRGAAVHRGLRRRTGADHGLRTGRAAGLAGAHRRHDDADLGRVGGRLLHRVERRRAARPGRRTGGGVHGVAGRGRAGRRGRGGRSRLAR